MVLNNPLFVARNSRSGAYQIEQSLRFDGSSHLNRTPSSAGTTTTWTFSCWLKLAGTSEGCPIAAAESGGYTALFHSVGGEAHFRLSRYVGSNQYAKSTTSRYRDPSGWYHLVTVFDSTNSTASDRIRYYVNGVRLTDFSNDGSSVTNVDPGLNAVSAINSNTAQRIGSQFDGTYGFLKGYMAEAHMLDGTAVTDALDFGEYDDNGVWRPIQVSGVTYGTNGFYLKFDPSATNGIGHDHSGNGNNFTASGFTTSGTGTDVFSDTPTTNYGTFNPVAPSGIAVSEGNLSLSFTNSGSETHSVPVTMGATSGKFYVEFKYTASGSGGACGVGVVDLDQAEEFEGFVSGWTRIIYLQTGGIRKNNTSTASGLAITRTAGDIVGVDVDCDNGQVRFYVNGTLQHTETGLSYGRYGFHFEPNIGGSSNTCTVAFNGGQRAFEQTVPTGYKALNTSNLPAPGIADGSDYFQTVLYTGNNTTHAITVADNSGNAWGPDLVWIKPRSTADNHRVNDKVRGVNKTISTNLTTAEYGPSNAYLDSFNSDGFTISSSDAGWNSSSHTYVAWNWLEGASQGFDIVSYTGNDVNGRSIAHSLGVTPAFIIVKARNANEAWAVWHQGLNSAIKYLTFTTAAAGTASAIFGGGANEQLPDSTNFYVGSNGMVNDTGVNYIAYCFAEVEGYSKFGSYTGNGSSDGAFIYLGFKPALIILKETGNANNWHIWDSTRSNDNPIAEALYPNLTSAEGNPGAIDLLSNGFKIRTTNTDAGGRSGGNYIFAAFASSPFGGDGVSPATAR